MRRHAHKYQILSTGIVLLVAMLCHNTLFAQQVPYYSHSYLNPYLINPAYAGIEGRPFVDLTHRRQWLGIEDAPITSNFTFHTPVIAGLNLGLNITQDNYGIFQTSSGLLSLGYTVQLGFNQYVSFGLSGGGKVQSIDPSGLDLNDPALIGVLDRNTQLDGNVGLAYHIGGLNIGFSLQNIFNTSTFPTQDFDEGEIDLIRNYVINADYMLYFGGDDYIFQPFGLYRSYQGFENQFEAGGIFHVKHSLWIGGSYRQNFGIIGLLGIKVKNSFSVAYAYEMPSAKANGINKSSHEINLGLVFGQKKEKAKKYQTFIASQKPVKPKQEKKPKKEEPVKEEPIITEETIDKEPLEETTDNILDSLNQGGNKIRLIIENSRPDPIPQADSTVSPISVPVEVNPETNDDSLKPAVITKKGNHPFEMPEGHYIVVGAFGVFENAVRANDAMLSKGYDADFGFSSDKKLFYVYILGGASAESAREKRNELRTVPAYKNAWYLLVE